MVVDDVRIAAHGHDSSLHLDLLQDVLLGHLHDPDCPALVAVLPVEGLVDRAHGPLAQLLGEPVALVGVLGLKRDFGHLLVELYIGQQGVVGDLLSLFQVAQNTDKGLWVLLNFVAGDIVFLEQVYHVIGEPLDPHGAVEVHLQVHLVLEIGRPALG